MTKRELFICEICGGQYNTEDECKNCENSHIIPKQIVRYSYIPAISRYPYGVTIKMSDGEELSYNRL